MHPFQTPISKDFAQPIITPLHKEFITPLHKEFITPLRKEFIAPLRREHETGETTSIPRMEDSSSSSKDHLLFSPFNDETMNSKTFFIHF